MVEHLVVVALLLHTCYFLHLTSNIRKKTSWMNIEKFWRDCLNDWDSVFMVPLCLTGTSSGQPRESPFFLLGKVIMQQSYVCALIAMMVTTRITDQHLLSVSAHTKRTFASALCRFGASCTTAGWLLCFCYGLVSSGSCAQGTTTNVALVVPWGYNNQATRTSWWRC